MRKSQRSAAQIEAEELHDFKRKSKRNAALTKLVPERDRGWGRIKDYNQGREVYIEWFVDKFPDNMFGIRLDGANGELLVLDAEELRKYLRWV